MLKISFEYALGVDEKVLSEKYQQKIEKLHQLFMEKVNSNDPKEMVGWYNFPDKFNDFERIQKTAEHWKKLKINHVVVAGIGGSYSGIKALLDMVKPNQSKLGVKFHFINSVSNVLIHNVVENVKNKNFGLVCISKSGKTLETSVAFRIFRELLWKRFKKESSERIAIITDETPNVLHEMSKKHRYALFTFPSDVGGRFSTLTPVSLFPAAVAGINIKEVIEGAKLAKKDFSSEKLSSNLAYLYAAFRTYMYEHQNKVLEFFATYQANLQSLAVQHRQLFAETEGKDGKGIMPIVTEFTTDLHSLGQYLQEGKKIFFETVLLIDQMAEDVIVPKSSFDNDDALNHLTNQSLRNINLTAAHSVLTAHSQGGSPNLLLQLQDMTERSFGYFYFFLSLATSMTAFLSGVNPFNQPGVEKYKSIMREKIKMLTE